MRTSRKQNFSTVEAAAYLKMHKNSLANMRSNRIGPRYIKTGHSVHYTRFDLDTYLKERIKLVDPKERL